MGRPELAQHPDYDTNAKRVARRAEVDKIVQDWLLTLPSQEALRILEENEVPNGPIYSIAGIFADEHYRAREDIVAVEDPKLGMVRMSNVVPRLSLTPGRVDFPGRELGQDNDEVYGRILGLSEAEIVRLREEGVI
jgi:crotonobetainyl-CoA:carnitine CoA-transferase CaiB-like acyl-CoA transferase